MRFRPFAVLMLAGALAGCASHPPPQRREQEWRAPVEILQKYAGADSTLTRQQLEADLRRDFNAADLNHDGVLDADEVRAVNAKRWEDDQSAISPLQDWNGDGVVDFGEFAATGRALFNEFDENRNGVLTKIELYGPAREPGKPAGPPSRREGGP